MPIAVLSAKGQMTIPRDVRKALHLRASERIVIVVDGDQAVLKPLRGTILDIGGTIKTPAKDKPADFRKIREEVRKRVGRKAAARGAAG
ncbi:MAG: AbrB/MazE/SpoVT family DNA-binding domain-containing protein [Nitrospirota bacterium]|jgi:AbrB family looped-hinge helix DNA binding protein